MSGKSVREKSRKINTKTIKYWPQSTFGKKNIFLNLLSMFRYICDLWLIYIYLLQISFTKNLYLWVIQVNFSELKRKPIFPILKSWPIQKNPITTKALVNIGTYKDICNVRWTLLLYSQELKIELSNWRMYVCYSFSVYIWWCTPHLKHISTKKNIKK